MHQEGSEENGEKYQAYNSKGSAQKTRDATSIAIRSLAENGATAVEAAQWINGQNGTPGYTARRNTHRIFRPSDLHSAAPSRTNDRGEVEYLIGKPKRGANATNPNDSFVAFAAGAEPPTQRAAFKMPRASHSWSRYALTDEENLYLLFLCNVSSFLFFFKNFNFFLKMARALKTS